MLIFFWGGYNRKNFMEQINEVSDFSYPEAKEFIKQIRYHLDEAERQMFKP